MNDTQDTAATTKIAPKGRGKRTPKVKTEQVASKRRKRPENLNNDGEEYLNLLNGGKRPKVAAETPMAANTAF